MGRPSTRTNTFGTTTTFGGASAPFFLSETALEKKISMA